jgi:hypothetical protein
MVFPVMVILLSHPSWMGEPLDAKSSARYVQPSDNHQMQRDHSPNVEV